MASEVPDQDDQVAIGSCIQANSSMYRVDAFLGQGSFGKVVKCSNISNNVTVAIKMIRGQGIYAKQSKHEIEVLKKLRDLDSNKYNIVRWYQGFFHGQHICLMFEHLEKNLHEFMKERHFQPLLLKEIRPIVQQLTIALEHLGTAGIIHADLKPENVMLVNHEREPYKVKIIDFGLACKVSSAKLGSYTQTRPYRSPEIVLGLPFTQAIDMWSLGCMAAYMDIGCTLYPAMNQYDLMRYITQTQGQPPDHLLASGKNTSQFFQRFHFAGVWKLKRPELYQRETGVQPLETRKLKFSSLDNLLHIRPIRHEHYDDRAAERNDRWLFVDMLKGMLQLDAAERITPRQVLEHQFISKSTIMTACPLSSQHGAPTTTSSQTTPSPRGNKRKMTDSHGDRKRYKPTSPYPSLSNCSSPHKRRADRKRSADRSASRSRHRDSPLHVRRSPNACDHRKSRSPVANRSYERHRTRTPHRRCEDGKRRFRESYARRSPSRHSRWTPRSERERERDRDSPRQAVRDRSRSPAEHRCAHSSQRKQVADEDVPRQRRRDHRADNSRERSAVEEGDRRSRDYNNSGKRKRSETDQSRDSRGHRRERSRPPPHR